MDKRYEPGMKITYDPVSKRVLVAFRGRIVVLPHPCEDESQATAEGEDFCRAQGWSPEAENSKPRKPHTPW